jgi:hypothetical protein
MEVIREVKRTDISTPFDPINLIKYIKNLNDPQEGIIRGIENGFDHPLTIIFFSRRCPSFTQNIEFSSLRTFNCNSCGGTSFLVNDWLLLQLSIPKDACSIKPYIENCYGAHEEIRQLHCDHCRVKRDGKITRSLNFHKELPKILIVNFTNEEMLTSSQFSERSISFGSAEYKMKAVYLTKFSDHDRVDRWTKPTHASAVLFEDNLEAGQIIEIDDTIVTTRRDDILMYARMAFLTRID